MKTLLITFLLSSTLFFNNFTAQAEGLNFSISDESYINDIPFSTETIFNQLTNPAVATTYFQLSDESYIDDIPFNTSKIAEESAQINNYQLKEEGYVDDIPFNTSEIVRNL